MAVRTLVTFGYGNGTFNGTIPLAVTDGYAIGVDTSVTAEGLEYAAGVNRMHYAGSVSRMHYTAPSNRGHYSATDEDT